MPSKISENVLSWASDLDNETIQQASRTSRLPFLGGHVALMPDAHFGIGATVGSVIPTVGAIIPAAVGVDIGCGMAAIKINITADDLPDNIDSLMPKIEKAIPAGVGKGKDDWRSEVNVKNSIGEPFTKLDNKLISTTISQCGTLGSGNHFFEVCLDENDGVWIVLHSGSRGIGNKLGKMHIDIAKKEMKKAMTIGMLEDPDLAWFVQGTPEFDAYIKDMLWAQDYARLNRDVMLDAAWKAFRKWFGWGEGDIGRQLKIEQTINCHHNFTQMEHHHGKDMWITRKGAIKAAIGDLGIIPGSMGTRSYIIEGKGSAASYNSCSHGAGRRYSRKKAKEIFNPQDLADRMAGKVWNAERAASLVDEIPDAYKDIDQVMEDQKDLVTPLFTLHQIFNYKG